MLNKINHLFSFFLLTFILFFSLSSAYSADQLVVTVDGNNVNLDWSAMPNAQSTTLYVALSDHKGGIDVNTLGFANMGKKTSLYAPGLPSGLIIYSAIIAHTSHQGDVASNIAQFMPFGGSVTYPESDGVLMQIDDPKGIGSISLIGTSNTDGSDNVISKITGNNNSGSFVMYLTDNKPASYVEEGFTLNFIYSADNSVDAEFVWNEKRIQINKTSTDMYYRADSQEQGICKGSADEYLSSIDNRISADSREESRIQDIEYDRIIEKYEQIKLLLMATAISSSQNDADYDLKGYLDKTNKISQMQILIISSQASYSQIKEEIRQKYLNRYNKQCKEDDTPSSDISITTPDNTIITIDTSCPIPAGAEISEQEDRYLVIKYLLNGNYVGSYQTWRPEDNGEYHLIAEQCYNASGQWHGWSIQYFDNNNMQFAEHYQNGQLDGRSYAFFEDEEVRYDNFWSNGEKLYYYKYDEAGELQVYWTRENGSTYY
ncbi:MAG: hypothetical protein KZQ83_12575 [gamma proteobacterium symbiont of Taylorina sp.]|nr:hypothetical protein [gamma proteobacterium symbiont of Taylorina sp.]